jgi:hypothetical protein
MSTLKTLLTTTAVLVTLTASAQADMTKWTSTKYYPDLWRGACIGEVYYPTKKVNLNIGVPIAITTPSCGRSCSKTRSGKPKATPTKW